MKPRCRCGIKVGDRVRWIASDGSIACEETVTGITSDGGLLTEGNGFDTKYCACRNWYTMNCGKVVVVPGKLNLFD